MTVTMTMLAYFITQAAGLYSDILVEQRRRKVRDRYAAIRCAFGQNVIVRFMLLVCCCSVEEKKKSRPMHIFSIVDLLPSQETTVKRKNVIIHNHSNPQTSRFVKAPPKRALVLTSFRRSKNFS
jgi:hypothetical protein